MLTAPLSRPVMLHHYEITSAVAGLFTSSCVSCVILDNSKSFESKRYQD